MKWRGDETTRRCTKCGEEKDIYIGFNWRHGNPISICRSCKMQYQAQWRAKNPEKEREIRLKSNRKWRAENPERNAELARINHERWRRKHGIKPRRKKNMYTAQIIGETSAGMTALEIYKNDELIYSIDYFENGATDTRYQEVMRQIIDDAEACADVENWAEFGRDMERYSAGETTHVIGTYRPESGWEWDVDEILAAGGQSMDIIMANRDRIPANVVNAIIED